MGEGVAGMPSGWPHNHKDIAQRVFTEALREHLPTWLGGLPPIVGSLPADLPMVDTSDRHADRVFITSDGWILDLELESSDDGSLDRFLMYATRLWVQHHRPLRTLVLQLGPPVTRGDRVDGGALQFGLRREYVGARDARATGARLQAKRAARDPGWTGADVLDVGFWPHMAGWDVAVEHRVRQAAEMALALPAKWAAAALACVLGMAPAAVAVAVLESLKEVRGMRSVLDVLVEEAEAAEARGESRGEARGEARGQVEGRRLALVRVLRARFGEAADPIGTRIARMDDADQLDRGLELAATADSLEAFLRGWD